MTEPTVTRLITEFTRAYERLYQRWPDELRIIDETWVVVNGMQVNATSLQCLTEGLKLEYEQTSSEKKKTTMRLVDWFRKSQNEAASPR